MENVDCSLLSLHHQLSTRRCPASRFTLHTLRRRRTRWQERSGEGDLKMFLSQFRVLDWGNGVLGWGRNAFFLPRAPTAPWHYMPSRNFNRFGGLIRWAFFFAVGEHRSKQSNYKSTSSLKIVHQNYKSSSSLINPANNNSFVDQQFLKKLSTFFGLIFFQHFTKMLSLFL
jgi:hypothetical protein